MSDRVLPQYTPPKDIEGHPIVPEELPIPFNNAEGSDRLEEPCRQSMLQQKVLTENMESWSGDADGNTICCDSQRRVYSRLVSAFLQRNRA